MPISIDPANERAGERESCEPSTILRSRGGKRLNLRIVAVPSLGSVGSSISNVNDQDALTASHFCSNCHG
jgi:hypothetical protein